MELFNNIVVTGTDFIRFSVQFVTVENILMMFLAVMVGILFGMLPGLSATIGIALFTGLTYGFSLDKALVVLFGIYITRCVVRCSHEAK